MDKDEFDIELLDDALGGSRQKRFERERTKSRPEILTPRTEVFAASHR